MEIKTKLTDLVGMVLKRIIDGGWDATWPFFAEVTPKHCEEEGPWIYQSRLDPTIYIDVEDTYDVKVGSDLVASFDYSGDVDEVPKCLSLKDGDWVSVFQQMQDAINSHDFDWQEAKGSHAQYVADLMSRVQ